MENKDHFCFSLTLTSHWCEWIIKPLKSPDDITYYFVYNFHVTYQILLILGNNVQELWPTSREQYVNMWICEPVNPSALPLSCSWLKTVRDNTTLDSKVSCIFFPMYVDNDFSELMIQCHGPYVFHHLFPPLTLFDPPPPNFDENPWGSRVFNKALK